MSDIVDRLRESAEGGSDAPWWWESTGGPAPLMRDAADEIERLRRWQEAACNVLETADVRRAWPLTLFRLLEAAGRPVPQPPSFGESVVQATLGLMGQMEADEADEGVLIVDLSRNRRFGPGSAPIAPKSPEIDPERPKDVLE